MGTISGLMVPVVSVVSMVSVVLVLVPKVVGMNNEPPLPKMEKVPVAFKGTSPFEPLIKPGKVGAGGKLVGSLTLGTTVGSLAGRSDPSVTLAELVLNGPPMPVDVVLGTPVPTGPVPDAVGLDVNGTKG